MENKKNTDSKKDHNGKNAGKNLKKAHLKKQNRIAAVILIVGTILSVVIFGPKKQEETVAGEPPVTVVKTIEMGTENSKIADLEKTVYLSSADSANVVAEYTGRITQINFEEGREVKEGQVLATFDQSNVENSPKVALESASNNLTLAQDNLGQTKDAADESVELAKNARKIAEVRLDQAKDAGDDDATELAKKNLENAKDLEDQAEIQAEIQVNNAELAVNQSEETVKQSRIAFEKTIIKAPISGIIASKEIANNDYVSIGQEVAQIVGKDQLESKVFLSEDEVTRVKVGDEVKIIRGNDVFAGKIASLSLIANADNNRNEVVINSEKELVNEANRSATVIFHLRLNSNNPASSFFVPLSSVKIGQQKNIVFVEENGMARSKEVVIGQTVGDQIEILEGLSKGDQLIVENNRNLRDGEVIKIENE